MPSRKFLNSVAHNFGHSFVSLMNYMETDYVMGLIQSQMKEFGLHKLEIDILENRSFPEELLTRKIRKAIRFNMSKFTDYVLDSGSSMEYVNSAAMSITFDFTVSRANSTDSSIEENPYVCEVVITDDNGRVYKKQQKGWWFPEPMVNRVFGNYNFDFKNNLARKEDKSSLWSKFKLLFS